MGIHGDRWNCGIPVLVIQINDELFYQSFLTGKL